MGGVMEITYIADNGCRQEWKCRQCNTTYCISYHYLNNSWSVQLFRTDGEREILNSEEAHRILAQFPMEQALELTKSDIRGPSVWAQSKRTAER